MRRDSTNFFSGLHRDCFIWDCFTWRYRPGRLATLPILLLLLSACGGGSPDSSTDGFTEPLPFEDPSSGLDIVDPQETATVQALPPGMDPQPPANDSLNRILNALKASGGEIYLRYQPEAPRDVFNVRINIEPSAVQTDPGSGIRYADVDIDGQLVRITEAPLSGMTPPQMLAAGYDPASLTVLKTYMRDTKANGSPGEARLEVVALFDLGDERSGPLLAKTAGDLNLLAPTDDCDKLAWSFASEVPPIAVKMPEINNCAAMECGRAGAAWIRAVHDVWRVRQMLDIIASESNSQRRAFLWKQPAASPKGEKLSEHTSLAYFFGSYTEDRFNAIRWAYNRLWEDMFDHKLQGLKLDFECRPSLAGDVCNTNRKNVPAHHIVKSNIKLCDGFFDRVSDDYRALLMVHEMLHHIYIPFKIGKDSGFGPIQDTHTHSHGNSCAANPRTNKGYGLDALRHLATYSSSGGKTCSHRNYALRNNDTYAWASMRIGGHVRRGATGWWPYKDNNPGTPPQGEPCDGAPPPPGGKLPDGVDPLNQCKKIGTEYICPGSGGSGGFELNELDIAMECPPTP